MTAPPPRSLAAANYAVILNDIHAHLSCITTTEELDALPPESIILEWGTVAMTKDYSGCWFGGADDYRYMSNAITLPVILLWLGHNRYSHDTDKKDANS